MKRATCLMAVVSVAAMLGFSGCKIGNVDLGGELVKEATPTPEPVQATATPSPTPSPTPAPLSTATPTPWRIGTKTSQSSYVYLTNSTGEKIRQVYLMASDGYDWGKNLVPSESTIRVSEQVQLCYTPFTAEDGQTVTSYSLKFVTQTGNVYQVDTVPLQDMQQAVLQVEDDEVFLRYTSLGEKTEKSISGSGADYAYSDWDDSDYEDSYEEDSYDYDYDYDNSYDYDYDDNDYSYDYDEDYQYDDEDYYDEDYDEDYDYDYDDDEYN